MRPEQAGMTRPAARGSRGFSLIELMVTVAVVAILSAIAIPAYNSYVLRSHRSEAMNALTSNRQQLERCYSQNFSYLGCPTTVGGAATTVCAAAVSTTNGYYQVSCPVLTATTFQLQALALGRQVQDSSCYSMTVTNSGLQAAKATAAAGGGVTTLTCWGSN